MKFAILKPAEGCRVKDPRDYSLLPESGRRVRMDTYWRRRIADKSVEVLSSLAVVEDEPSQPDEGE